MQPSGAALQQACWQAQQLTARLLMLKIRE